MATLVASAKNKEIITKLLASEEPTPLEVMLTVMSTALKKKNIALAMNAAQMAAPYIHPRLANTTISGNPNAPLAVSIIDDIKR